MSHNAQVEIAFLLVVLAVAVLVGTALAARLDLPAPLLLIAAGAGASYLPFVPEIPLEPEVVLIGLLPPLLYAAALQTSLVDFNANRRPILLLSVGLVIFTTLGVGALVHALLPDVTWPIALAIGAVVAPTDAVAAIAVARQNGLPRRVVTILEGESLFNDAAALVALRTAIAATAASVGIGRIGWDFLLAAVGGVLVGLLGYLLVAKVRRRVTDPVFDSGLSLLTPFVVYLVAEQILASGLIAVVVAGLLLAHRAPILQTAQSRILERLNWRTIAFVLENTVFLLIGLQTRWIIEDVGVSEVAPSRIALLCLGTLVAVIVLRLVWVLGARFALVRPGARGRDRRPPAWNAVVILGWAGVRGVVTLAAAFIIPEEVEHRPILLLIAFTVVAGTLFLQGLSLPWLARRLQVPSPDPAEDALARAALLQQASQAGLQELDRLGIDDRHGTVDVIRGRLDQRNFAAWERLSTTAGEESPSDVYARVRRSMIEAERHRVLEIRSTGQVPSEVVAEVLAMLDIEETMIDGALKTKQGTAGVRPTAGEARLAGETCADLADHPVIETTPDPVCRACLEEGTAWVALRECLTCGHVGCCDSSPSRHATAHFHESTHPVLESAEPGETWRWCFVHHLTA